MQMSMLEAIYLALDQEMATDSNIVFLSSSENVEETDVNKFEVLKNKYGERVIVMGSETIASAATGMAIAGLRPVVSARHVELFRGLFSQVSRLRANTRGKHSAEMTIRIPYGIIEVLERHESPESFYTHIPGLKVVVASSPYVAKGLLAAAIRNPNPVVFLEPVEIYNTKEEVPEREYTIKIGKAEIVKKGDDVTLITYGSMLKTAKAAIENMKESIELIDLRTLNPLDEEAIIKSVKKTGRAVIVHEAPKMLGIGAEISAIINEKALLSLEAPVERVTGFDTVAPVAAHRYVPDEKRIKKAIKKVSGF